jgi:hypothetical protein
MRVMDDVVTQIAGLKALATPALKERWRQVIGTEPPAYSRAEILRLGIAYQLQAQASGALPRALQRRLLRIAEHTARNPKPALAAAPRLKAGTRMFRRWRGEVHEVTVLGQGFEYRGSTYGTLSEIARAVTGTRWSGPAFFGLTKRCSR